MGTGAIVAALVADRAGVRTALVTIGLVCPLAAAAAWRRLRRLDRSIGVRDRDIGLLRSVDLLGVLPLPAVEQLARHLEPVAVPAGEVVVAEGDAGDRYYVIESGTAAVTGDGRTLATLGPGQGFGEIALLHSTRRTATVRALSDLRLQTLRPERFVAVVLGYPPSARQAGTAVDSMLHRYAPSDTTGRGPVPPRARPGADPSGPPAGR
ncbi:cyclic nucleotide-binding domain-containing protein [Geodermatophilus sp. FMUSA9-8]|uniref:cyclic nucleotide-binding domain-containing protein n=1 Tax=Geodermatophilus sp. FMUSA9-8 TaxID=3120155 RepID=UPI00300A1272